MVDVIKTRTDLIEAAATELGARTSGQELSDEDRDTIDGKVDPLTMQLSADDVADFADLDQIPSQYFIPLVMLLANVSAPSFGQAYSVEVKREYERQLRRLTAGRPTSESIRTQYY